MTRRVQVVVVPSLAVGLLLATLWLVSLRRERATLNAMRARIAELREERNALRARLGRVLDEDPRLRSMPRNEVRVGVPTTLMRRLIERVVGGFVDTIQLELSGLRAHKKGKIKKLVTLGEYELDVTIEKVTGRLKMGRPDVRFGGNTVELSLPVRIVRGAGHATIDFRWDGKNVGGAVCGDMRLRRRVSGRVRPKEYQVRGALGLSSTTRQILASPQVPRIEINLQVEPSAASWAVVEKLLDEKRGVCGFVLDRVDIKGALEDLVAKGFDVTLPTDQLVPVAVPVGIAPTVRLGDEVVTLAVEIGDLAITEHMLWLGADVRVEIEPAGSGAAPALTSAALE